MGSAPSALFAPVKHRVPMMSLDNAFSFEELQAWGKRMERYIEGDVELCCELKIDGVAMSLLYESGRFTLDLPPGPALIEVSQLGYERARLDVRVAEGMAPLRVTLSVEPVPLAEVTVAASSFGKTGKSEGAKLVAGGSRASVDGSKGFFVEPTIFDAVNNDMKIAQEEIFGPVLATLTFDDLDQVAEQANQNIYGLAAAIWTNDVKKAHTLSRKLRAGIVWINTYGLMDAAVPFGGYKQSGFGRELGMHAIEHYTELKSIWMSL